MERYFFLLLLPLSALALALFLVYRRQLDMFDNTEIRMDLYNRMTLASSVPGIINPRITYAQTYKATVVTDEVQPLSKLNGIPDRLYSEKYKSKEKLIVISKIPKYRKNQVGERTVHCGDYSCIVSTNSKRIREADAVIFDVFLFNDLDPKPKRSSPNQVWVFFTREPWINFRNRIKSLEHWEDVFNWTMTYQRNSDIYIPYFKLIPAIPRKVPNWKAVIGNKTGSVLGFISNCDSKSQRELYIAELHKYIDVDIVGYCGRGTCKSGRNSDDDCYPKYRFYLAFENSMCKDYFTEKYFKTFRYNIIPIVRGYVDYANVLPRDTYINTGEFNSPKDLAKYLRHLENTPSEYLKLLKRHAEYSTDSGGQGLCTVCSRLNELEKHRKSYPKISSFMDCFLPNNSYI